MTASQFFAETGGPEPGPAQKFESRPHPLRVQRGVPQLARADAARSPSTANAMRRRRPARAPALVLTDALRMSAMSYPILLDRSHSRRALSLNRISSAEAFLLSDARARLKRAEARSRNLWWSGRRKTARPWIFAGLPQRIAIQPCVRSIERRPKNMHMHSSMWICT